MEKEKKFVSVMNTISICSQFITLSCRAQVQSEEDVNYIWRLVVL